MVSIRPAYSAPFHDTRLQSLMPLDRVHGITADWAWGGSTGAGVKIAVVDSGIDASHPDVGQIQGYASFKEDDDGKVVLDTDPHDDCFGHGTACAGVIRSLAPDCEIYSVKVLGEGLRGSSKVFEAGLRWALRNDIRVCNLSLGMRKKESAGVFHELADRAYFNNIALITAAPNDRDRPSYPSLYSAVISVASHSVPDPYTFYYNPQPPVEFGALGIDVRLCWRDHKHTTATGNSFAAPHMTGLVAKILGKHPELTVFQLKTVLRELAANVDRTRVSPPPPLLGVPSTEGGRSTL